MHRKLIHSVRALGIALSLLTAGLILALPANGPGGLAARAETAPEATAVQVERFWRTLTSRSAPIN